MRNTFIALLAFAACGAAHASSPSALHALDEATGAALQADASQAVALLKKIRAAEFDGNDATLRDCIVQRFDNPQPAAVTETDPFARTLLEDFRRYWHRSLREPAVRDSAEQQLLDSLRALVHTAPKAEFDDIWPPIENRLRESGLHVLGGRTGHLLELMIWRREDVVTHHVRLPEQEKVQDIRVTQVDDFVSFGWAHYATCGRRATGGWAHPDMLFAVMPRYAGGAGGEQFRVSLLGHEAQHAADKTHLPGLASWELEYRAKLTELSLADTTRAQILSRFIEDQGDDMQSPHSYANKRVLAALRVRLGVREDAQLSSVPLGDLQRAAVSLLRADTAARRTS
jgi:hypothetical protein